jgi:predicted nucleic acid-binding Zn ribbon protein
VKAGEGEDALGECAICLDAVEGTGKEMPCGHRFHGRCLERWLGVHGNCPVCRRELPAPAKEEEEDSAASAEGGEEERRRPRAAVVVSYLVFGGGRAEAQQEPEREEPWNIRIEDVD